MKTLRNLFVACLLLTSSAIFAAEGTVKISTNNTDIVVVIDTPTGNITVGDRMRVMNCPPSISENDRIVFRVIEMGSTREKVAVFVGIAAIQ
jgi:hypothetical protein